MGVKKKKFTTTNENFRRPLEEGVFILGKFIRHFILFIPLIFKPIIFIVGFALIVAFLVVWILSIISFILGAPFAQALAPDQPLIAFLSIFNLAILIGIPILSLALLAGRLVFKTRYNVRWSRGLWVLWSINIVSLFGVGSYLLSQFSVSKTTAPYTQNIPVSEGVLTLVAAENPYKNSWIRIGSLDIAGDVLASTAVNIIIKKATGDQFLLEQEFKARGKTVEDAIQTASIIRQEVAIKENKLTFNPYFALKSGEKWRNQESNIYISIPEGKSIKFEHLPYPIRNKIQLEHPDQPNYKTPKNGETWVMTSEGLVNNH